MEIARVYIPIVAHSFAQQSKLFIVERDAHKWQPFSELIVAQMTRLVFITFSKDRLYVDTVQPFATEAQPQNASKSTVKNG